MTGLSVAQLAEIEPMLIIVTKEAKLRNLSIEDMATLVLEQNHNLIDKELGRISTKIGDK